MDIIEHPPTFNGFPSYTTPQKLQKSRGFPTSGPGQQPASLVAASGGNLESSNDEMIIIEYIIVNLVQTGHFDSDMLHINQLFQYL